MCVLPQKFRRTGLLKTGAVATHVPSGQKEKRRADLASGRQLVDISNEVHDKGGSRPLQDLPWGTHLLNAPPAAWT